jgi:ribosomal protein S18 acetylase RimI-like enzyme
VTRDCESAGISLRSVRPDDRAFLLSVYASTRASELATVEWDAAQKAAFVRMQFDAQHAYYQEHYPDTSFDVILLGAEAVGRLYVSRWTDELRIVDIALLPEFCNRGIGSALLRRLQAEARAARKPLRIHVERFNPALRLYERLGFRQIEDRGVYLFMEWRDSDNSQPPTPKERRSNHPGEKAKNSW